MSTVPLRRNLRMAEYFLQEQNLAPNIGWVSGQLLRTRRTTYAERLLDFRRGTPVVWKVISTLEFTSSICADEKSTPDSLKFIVSPGDQSSCPSRRYRNGS